MLNIQRHFTKEGQTLEDVFNDIKWEVTDAIITGKNGSLVFEQKNVEFPEYFSENAKCIVASKYFYGKLDTKEREFSLKQLISRVVNKISDKGLKHKYFSDYNHPKKISEYDDPDRCACGGTQGFCNIDPRIPFDHTDLNNKLIRREKYKEQVLKSKSEIDTYHNNYINDANSEYNIFRAELGYMILHQMFSFNSPVWFNIGLDKAQAPSACYITSIEDNIDSIFNHAVTEGKIFKDGSGNGVNISSLRHEGAHIKGGGKSSGPISFNKIYETVAAATKSGGVTRRAARMVIMNINHPDIEKFITSKSEEEKKAKILIKNGYSDAIDGEAYSSVFFQNANHSVRITNEFMDAVENDKDWNLIDINTKEIVKTVKAKYLWDLIAKEAWETGDPGIQFHDLIQEWDTCPGAGEITATNPCFTADTKILTDKGVFTIEEIITNAYNEKYTKALDKNLQPSLLSQYLLTGKNKILKIEFSDGRSIRVTENHEFLLKNKDGKTQAKYLEVGDIVNTLCNEIEYIGKNTFDFIISKIGKEHKLPYLPSEWSVELGEILGHLIGDGCVAKNNVTTLVYGTHEDEKIKLADKHKEWLTSIFEREPMDCEVGNGCRQLRFAKNAIGRFFRELGVSNARAVNKHIPSQIFKAPKNIMSAFLRGYFGADGTVYGRKEMGECEVSCTSVSKQLIDDVQLALQLFGIRSISKIVRTSKEHGIQGYRTKDCYRLRINPSDLEKFKNQIGFSVNYKNEKLSNLLSCRKHIKSIYRNYEVSVTGITEQGIEPTFNVTEPVHNLIWANGLLIPQCSEYIFKNFTSCNLSSFNLMKFFKDKIDENDATWYRNANSLLDIMSLIHGVKLATIAMNILIDFGDYPTEQIAKETRKYRTIGIGYANLGSLLMAHGLPYDSDEGRSLTGAITALITAQAYGTSNLLAKMHGPYEGWEDSHHNIIKKHLDAMPDKEKNAKNISKAISAIYDIACNILWPDGGKYRNAQVSVIAPTGSIGLMMDCDTTGCEPELSLVKYKSMVGGGYIKYVNSIVRKVLEKIGMCDLNINDTLEYIEDMGTIEGCGALDSKHLPIFDCSFKPQNGIRSLSPEAHVKMLAAIQPFISGGISKTVNLPTSATVEDIKNIYQLAYDLGVKCVAVYRDGCKANQPLSNKKEEIKTYEVTKPISNPQTISRKKMPDTRESITHKCNLGGQSFYITVGFYEDGSVGEVFITNSRHGSFASGTLDAVATFISFCLQYGAPLEDIVRKLKGINFAPNGFTKNKDVPVAKSVLDYLGKYLEANFLNQNSDLEFNDENIDKPIIEPKNIALGVPPKKETNGQPCPKCGELMKIKGRCFFCENCGSSVGGCGE